MGESELTNLDNKFSKDTVAFLDIRELLQEIEPSSYYGRKYFQDPEIFVRGEEGTLKEHFGRLTVLDAYISDIDSEKLKRAVRELKNIQASLNKIGDEALPSVVDFFEIKRFCYFYKRLFKLLSKTDNGKEIADMYGFKSVEEIWKLLDPRGNGQFFFSIDSDYAFELGKELEKYRSLEKEVFKKIAERLLKRYELPVASRTEFILQRSDIRNQALKKCKNVLVQGETAFSISYRIVKSESDKDYSPEIEKIENELSAEDIRYRTYLKGSLKKYLEDFYRMIETVTNFDRDMAAVGFRKRFDGCYPSINVNAVGLTIKRGCNHLIKAFCLKNDFEYDRVTIDLKNGSTIITGANMGGKTSALKTIGQLYIQCVLGLPVTAERFETSLFDGINCVFRTSEEEGLSGFAMEVMRIKNVFTEGVNLNLIDEFGSATNPREGAALAAAAVEVLDKKKAISVFVTHFSKPLEYGSVNYQTGFLKGTLSENIKPEDIYRYIDHHLKRIENNKIPKAARQISKALGLPDAVVISAEGIYKIK
jgi:dsDNA-specific endonuclease/ATPase MutS2